MRQRKSQFLLRDKEGAYFAVSGVPVRPVDPGVVGSNPVWVLYRACVVRPRSHAGMGALSVSGLEVGGAENRLPRTGGH